MEFPIILIAFFLLMALARVVTLVIHELGHAITGLILFKGGISIYIGSYGDPARGIHLKVGRLKIHFKYSPLLWNHGLCVSSSTETSFIKEYLVTLAGPFASLLTVMVSLFLLVTPEVHGALKLVSLFIFISSIIDCFRNFRPDKNPILLYDGTLTYNDGQTLKLLNEHRKIYKELTILRQFFANNEIEKGIIFFEEAYSKNPDANILRMGLTFHMKSESYEKALALFEELIEMQELSSEDYSSYALAYSYSGKHVKALELYNKSLQLNPTAFYALVNRGYTLNILQRFEEAIHDFSKALEIFPNFSYAYNNRGLSKIKLGNEIDGLKDIEKSMEINPEDSYAYKNLGIYHKDKGDLSKALNLFLKSKEIDRKTDGLNDLIAETELELSRAHTKTEL